MTRCPPGTPPVRALATVNPSETRYMRIFDPARTPAAAGACASGPSWVALGDIAPQLVSSVTLCEDRRFFTHHGIEWGATIGMALRALRGERVRGVSTITQQLARNLYLTPRRSIVRKLREIVLAARIERAMTKPRILELYLNLVEWGPGVWGCAEASAHYFGKAPRDLALFECTVLAMMLPAPRRALAGRHDAESQEKHLWLAYENARAGLATVQECTVCCLRVQELYRLLAKDVPLAEVLSAAPRRDLTRVI